MHVCVHLHVMEAFIYEYLFIDLLVCVPFSTLAWPLASPCPIRSLSAALPSRGMWADISRRGGNHSSRGVIQSASQCNARADDKNPRENFLFSRTEWHYNTSHHGFFECVWWCNQWMKCVLLNPLRPFIYRNRELKLWPKPFQKRLPNHQNIPSTQKCIFLLFMSPEMSDLEYADLYLFKVSLEKCFCIPLLKGKNKK